MNFKITSPIITNAAIYDEKLDRKIKIRATENGK